MFDLGQKLSLENLQFWFGSGVYSIPDHFLSKNRAIFRK